MSREKVGARPAMETTLLSTSAIGSPAAFSTAIKPAGNFITHPSCADTSILAQQPHNRAQLSDNVAGQLSLSLVSDAPHTEGPTSNDTSLGILDLDNIQESSMSVFLTSPRTTHDLVNTHPQSSTHPTSRSSPSPLSPLPSMEPLRLSVSTAPVGRPRRADHAGGDGGGEGGQFCLPEDLLEVSGSVGYSSGSETGSESQQTKGEGMVEQSDQTSLLEQNGIVPPSAPPPVVPSPDHVRQSGDGHEMGITNQLKQGLSKLPSSSLPTSSGRQSLTSVGAGERDGRRGGFSVSEILQTAEREGAQLRTSHLFQTTRTGNSLIAEQEEPSIMRQAAEFSRFEPDNLTSVTNRDSLLRSSRVPVSVELNGVPQSSHYQLSRPRVEGFTAGETTTVSAPAADPRTEREKSQLRAGGGGRDTEDYEQHTMNSGLASPERLPSAYFQPSSLYGSASQTPLTHTPSGTSSPSPPSSPHSQTSPFGDLGKRDETGVHAEKRHSHNPFDSEDAASVEEMGEEEFGGGLDSDSFMARLEADEAAIQEANKLMLPEDFSPATPQTPSFISLPTSTSHPPATSQSTEKALSIGTYFGQRSYKLGVLQTSGVAPGDRPHFSASSSHLLQSPPTPVKDDDSAVQTKTTPTSHVSPTSPDPADITLVSTQDGGFTDEPSQTSSAVQNSHILPNSPQRNTAFTRSSQALSLPSSMPVSQSVTQTVMTTVASLLPQTIVHEAVTSSALITNKLSNVSGLNADRAGTILGGVVAPYTAALVTRVSADSLTPVVTAHTPFPAHFEIPKLDLSGFSKTLDSTPTTRSSTSLKSEPPALSAEFKHHSVTQPLTQTVHTSVPAVTSVGSSPILPANAVSVLTSGSSSSPGQVPDMEFGLQQSGVDSGLSSGLDLRLASQYWKPSSASSTLMFPELSTATLSPPPAELGGFTCMPTPSIAHLSGGFNATSEDGSFLESLLGALPTSSTTHPLSPSTTASVLTTTPSTQGQSVHMAPHTQGTSLSLSPAKVTTESAMPPTPGHGVHVAHAQATSPLLSPTNSPLKLSPTTVKKSRLPSSTFKSSGSPPMIPKGTHSQFTTSPPTTTTTAPSLPTTSHDVSGSPGHLKTPRKQRPLSPRTETAKKKMAELKATLDATQFDAATYIAQLEETRHSVVAQQLTSDMPAKGSLVSEQATTPEPLPATSSVDITVVRTAESSTKLISQTPTVVSQKSSTVSESAVTVVSQSPTVVSQSPTTVVSQSATTVVSQSATTVVGQTMVGQTATTGQPDNLPFSATSSSTATFKEPLSLSPQQSSLPLSTTSLPPPAVTSSSAEQTDGGTLPTKVMEQQQDRHMAVPPLNTEQQRPSNQFVTVRDVGVGTTPGLRRFQARSPTHATSQTAVKEASILQQKSPPKPPPQPKISPSDSPQKHAVSFAPSSPTVLTSSRCELTSSSQPIYTSPRLHPHTSPLSPPPQLHSQPLHTYRERRKTPEPNSLKVPDSLCFKAPCCVGVTLHDHLQITNVGDRWLQLGFELNQLYCNGTHCKLSDLSSFSFPQRCFVSPRKSESIKVTFSPKQAGNFEAVLVCKAKLVVSSENDDSNYVLENIVVKALAVSPKLEVAISPTASEMCLDYGILVSGSSMSLPLLLTNHSPCELPLRLAISAPTLSQLHFSFDELSPVLKAPPSSPSSYLQTRPFTTALVLPPKPHSKSQKPEAFSANLIFKSPKNFTDDATPLGPPEEIKAQVDISVEGPNSTGVLYSVPVRATVGVARLHVPRSLQALSLSCTEKQSVTRDIPFKNAGNIPLTVALKFSTECDHFCVTPTTFELTPDEEGQVRVSFSPPTAPLIIDGYLMIRVQPDGPSYELKVRGTAVKEDELGGHDAGRENLLLCNKRRLYWGSVNTGDTVEQRLLLQNSFPITVPLQFSIHHQNQAFQLHTDDAPSVCWSSKADLPEHTQLQLNILFTPSSKSVFRNALDIFDTVHSRKFRIPLCGYGGASSVEIVNARRSISKGLWVELGPVALQQQSSVKVSLYNSGVRAAFVKALCLPLENREDTSPLPLSLANVTPSECVLQPQQMQDLTVVYQPSSTEEVTQCAETVSPLSRFIVMHGDEISRQRFQRAMASSSDEVVPQRCPLSKDFNREFLKHFPGQDLAPSELDFSLFEVENEERFFEQHLQQIVVTLSGSPETETPIPKPPLSTSLDSPPKSLHTLSPSHSTSQTTPTGHARITTPSSHITSSHTLLLPDSVVGQHSEKTLDVHNPYSQPLQWQLNSVASPFVRNAVGMSSDICKANYSAFWVHERRGTIPPHSSAQVLVEFQPHDVGSFSQMWDLQVTCTEIESDSKKITLSFGGKALSREPESNLTQDPTQVPVTHVRFAHHPPPHPPSPISHATHPHTVTAHPHTLTKRTIYIKEEEVEFPATQVGGQSILKVKVCNRDKFQHQFQVVSLSLPFSVDHHSFELGSRQCARLPVKFSPTQPGIYEAVLAVKTAAGHQAFSQLTGIALTSDETV